MYETMLEKLFELNDEILWNYKAWSGYAKSGHIYDQREEIEMYKNKLEALQVKANKIVDTRFIENPLHMRVEAFTTNIDVQEPPKSITTSLRELAKYYKPLNAWGISYEKL